MEREGFGKIWGGEEVVEVDEDVGVEEVGFEEGVFVYDSWG